MIPPPALHVWIAAAPSRGGNQTRAAALAIERADLQAAPPLPAGDPTARARAILADPLFVHDAPPQPPPPSLWQRFWAWVWRRPFWAWLRHLFGPLFNRIAVGRVQSNTAGYLALALAVMLLIALIARIAWRLPARFARSLHFDDLGSSRTRDPYALAEAAARRGDFSAAIAATFSAALYQLDLGEIVRFDGSRTPGEYRRAVRRAVPALEAPFDRIANAFVLAVYGERPADAATWNDVRDAYASLHVPPVSG